MGYIWPYIPPLVLIRIQDDRVHTVTCKWSHSSLLIELGFLQNIQTAAQENLLFYSPGVHHWPVPQHQWGILEGPLRHTTEHSSSTCCPEASEICPQTRWSSSNVTLTRSWEISRTVPERQRAAIKKPPGLARHHLQLASSPNHQRHLKWYLGWFALVDNHRRYVENYSQ